MSCSKIPLEKIEKLRTNMLNGIDTVCDHLENNREDQVQSALTQMENQITEDLLDVVDAHLQSNNQSPGGLGTRIHCRHQELSGFDLETESTEAMQPGETFWQKVCRWFQGMLR